MKKIILEHGMFWSWAIAIIATLGSLFFSEVKGYIPCTLCWYSRILMYPLVVILGISAVRKDYGQARYVLPLSMLGVAVASFHYALQKTSWFDSAGHFCSVGSCTAQYINWFGFMTIPFLALVAFIAITVLQWFIWSASKRNT